MGRQESLLRANSDLVEEEDYQEMRQGVIQAVIAEEEFDMIDRAEVEGPSAAQMMPDNEATLQQNRMDPGA